MAEYLTNTSELTAVADAIREKGGTTAQLSYPAGFVSAITAIETGGISVDDIALGTISGEIGGTASFIRSNAFAYNSRITKADFSLAQSIQTGAFYECSGLTSVAFPLASNIGANAFNDCKSLSIFDGTNIQTLGTGAFRYCSRLTVLNLEHLTAVSSYALEGCRLTELNLSTLTVISQQGFAGLHYLSKICAPTLISIYSGAFEYCIVSEAIFPNVTSLWGYAFNRCLSMGKLEFPKVNWIQGYAFGGCGRLLSLDLTGVSSVPTLQSTTAFYSTPINGQTASTGGVYGSIFVPASLYNSFLTAKNWSNFSSRIVSV